MAAEDEARADAGLGLDRKPVHQALNPHDAEATDARARDFFVEDLRLGWDPGSRIADLDDEELLLKRFN